MRKIKALALLVILLVSAGGTLAAKDKPSVQGPSLAVGSQYDGAHVYLAELAADNRLVGGSSPPSPTTQSRANRDFPARCE
jgi:hypothetical protein